MFERFSEAARNIVSSAQEEARLMRHERLGTEHLLVALAHEPEIAALGLDPERARGEVVKTVGLGEHDEPGFIPFTAAAQEALDDALGEAMRLGQQRDPPGPPPARRAQAARRRRAAHPRRRRRDAREHRAFRRGRSSRRTPGRRPRRLDVRIGARWRIVERGGPVAAWLRERGVARRRRAPAASRPRAAAGDERLGGVDRRAAVVGVELEQRVAEAAQALRRPAPGPSRASSRPAPCRTPPELMT